MQRIKTNEEQDHPLQFRISIRVVNWAVLTIFVCAFSAGAQKPLAALSANDLFKKADEDYAASRWEDARQALILGLQKKGKEDKRYTPMLQQVNTALSDREAAIGESACNSLDFPTCEKRIQKANEYASTPRTAKLEDTYNQRATDIRNRSIEALKDANTDPEWALRQLNALVPYGAVLPTLTADLNLVRSALVHKLLTDADTKFAERNWDGALNIYQRVFEIEAGNKQAQDGSRKATSAKQGYLAYEEAAARLSAEDYPAAYNAIQKAIDTYPPARLEFELWKTRIREEWAGSMLGSIIPLMDKVDDFNSMRDAYLTLEKVRTLDPNNPGIKEYASRVSEDYFPTAALIRATDLDNIQDYSKVGTSFLLKLITQRLRVKNPVPLEDIKGTQAILSRKLGSQLVLDVENLSAADQVFIDTLKARVRSLVLTAVGIPSLTLRSHEDYEKSPGEDLQFQDLRPDGRSRTARLTLSISRWEPGSWRQQSTKDIDSRYPNGQETVDNPAYLKLTTLLNEMSVALNKRPKKDAEKDLPTPEGWTRATLISERSRLETIPSSIQQPKMTSYKYQVVTYKQRTAIELKIDLRDYFTQDLIKSDTVSFVKEDTTTETVGVHENDDMGARNRPKNETTPAESLRDGKAEVSLQLDTKLLELLPSFNDRFYKEGEKALQANRMEDAVEAFVCHWALLRGNLESEQKKRISEIVKRETGFDLERDGRSLLTALSRPAQ